MYKRSGVGALSFIPIYFSVRSRRFEASQPMDGVVHLNSAFIGSFVCYINLPLTSSVPPPNSSSRFFSVFSSSNNVKAIWQEKNPPPAGVLIEPEGVGGAGIHNGWLHLLRRLHKNNPLFCPVRVVPVGSVPAR